MTWHPDVPDIPIKKPKEIEELELADRAVLDSMPGVEVKETVEQIAHAVARDYKKQKVNGNYDECLEIVSVALKVTGSAIGGKVGRAMIAACDTAAEEAAQQFFPVEQL